MKITMKELMYLAAIGAINEANFAKDMKDKNAEARYTEIMKTIALADTISEILEDPT